MRHSALQLRTSVRCLQAVLLLGLCGLSACSKEESASLTDAPTFSKAEGYVLGQAISEALPNGGPLLVLHAASVFPQTDGLVNNRLAGLREGLGASHFTVVEVSADDSLPAEELFALQRSLPEDFLADALQNHPDAVAVVSFLGAPPTLSDRGIPPLFVLGSGRSMAIDRLLGAGILKAAVVTKPDADLATRPSAKMSLQEIFDLRFDLLTS